MMKYVAPLDMLKDRLDISTVDGQVRVSLSYDGFLNLVELIISDNAALESPYLSQHLGRAARTAPAEPVARNGYFSGRSAAQGTGENWYLQRLAGGGDSGGSARGLDEGARERAANIQRAAETWQQQLTVVKTLMDVLNAATPPEEDNVAPEADGSYDPYEVQSLT
jgi:hypothetical protein